MRAIALEDKSAVGLIRFVTSAGFSGVALADGVWDCIPAARMPALPLLLRR